MEQLVCDVTRFEDEREKFEQVVQREREQHQQGLKALEEELDLQVRWFAILCILNELNLNCLPWNKSVHRVSLKVDICLKTNIEHVADILMRMGWWKWEKVLIGGKFGRLIDQSSVGLVGSASGCHSQTGNGTQMRRRETAAAADTGIGDRRVAGPPTTLPESRQLAGSRNPAGIQRRSRSVHAAGSNFRRKSPTQSFIGRSPDLSGSCPNRNESSQVALWREMSTTEQVPFRRWISNENLFDNLTILVNETWCTSWWINRIPFTNNLIWCSNFLKNYFLTFKINS